MEPIKTEYDPKKIVLSYSSMSDYIDCPKRFKLRLILRAKRPDRNDINTSPGKVLHNAAENYLKDLDDVFFSEKLLEAEFEKVASTTVCNQAQLSVEKDKMLSDIKNFAPNLYMFLFNNDLKNRKYYSECWFGSYEKPFILDGMPTQGASDIIIETDTPNIHILHDYKYTWATKNLKPEQLLFYIINLEKKFGIKIPMASFFLIQRKEPVFYAFTDEDKNRVKDKMKEIYQAIQVDYFPAKPHEKCQYCDYRSTCEEWQSYVKEPEVHLSSGFESVEL